MKKKPTSPLQTNQYKYLLQRKQIYVRFVDKSDCMRLNESSKNTPRLRGAILIKLAGERNLDLIASMCWGVVVTHADSQHRGCQFDSSMCHNENIIGEEGNGKPSHEFHFTRKTQSPAMQFFYVLR